MQNSDSGQNGELLNNNGSDSDCDSPTLDTVSGFSTCSSPLPPEPFEPSFEVNFTGEVTKDGDMVKYTIKTQRVNGDSREFIIRRQYEDFEWLEHCLVNCNPMFGVIIPPLPPKPAITSEMAEAKSKRQLGSDTKTLIGDEFHKDCRQLEQYLRLMLNHHLFGKNEALEKFLIEQEPPARAKVKKGIFSKLSDSLESRKSTHKDCEEFFQKERDWALQYGTFIKETNNAFNGKIYAQQRLCGVLGHLATALTLTVGTNEDISKIGMRLCTLFSEGLEDARHGLQMLCYNDENTLGTYFDLYSRYIEAEKEMLLHRTCLLVEYENANKVLDKAKPNKRESAEQLKLSAEKAFEECSDIARQEIKKFHRQRIMLFQESLEKYVEAQVRTCRDVYSMFTKTLSQINEFSVSNFSGNKE